MRDERSSTGRIDTPSPRVPKAPDPEPMPRAEFGRLLNLLLEAERAGAGLPEIRGWRGRLEFLNRGRLWVAKRVAAALPRIPASTGKSALQAMHASHLANIALCKQLLD